MNGVHQYLLKCIDKEACWLRFACSFRIPIRIPSNVFVRETKMHLVIKLITQPVHCDLPDLPVTFVMWSYTVKRFTFAKKHTFIGLPTPFDIRLYVGRRRYWQFLMSLHIKCYHPFLIIAWLMWLFQHFESISTGYENDMVHIRHGAIIRNMKSSSSIITL
jgi:hypothetical protein